MLEGGNAANAFLQKQARIPISSIFKGNRLGFVVKGHITNQGPGAKFGVVERLPSIASGKTGFGLGSYTDISLRGIFLALQKVDIFHTFLTQV